MHLILDTDIGSDVDDALTLIAGSTELISDGITTVCGDTARRASLTCRHPRLAGKDIGLTMAAGLRNARSGRAVWRTGHESVLGPDLGDEAVDAEAIK